jgi:hypothetical protein
MILAFQRDARMSASLHHSRRVDRLPQLAQRINPAGASCRWSQGARYLQRRPMTLSASPVSKQQVLTSAIAPARIANS